jgi:DNA-binding response OmpR family regulator
MSQVLVAEDSAAISLCLEDALIESGYSVAGPFNSCAAAMEWLQGNTPDLAILDVQLADGRCIEVARLLRGRQVPVLFLSGEVSPAHLPPDLRDLPWLGKPVGFDDLMDTVNGLRVPALSDRALEDQRRRLP